MRCNEARTIVDETGDLDRLPPAAARHLVDCSACERFGEELVALRALLREPGRVATPPDFDARLTRRIRAAGAPAPVRSRFAWLTVPSHALATAAGVGLVAFGSYTVVQTVSVSRPTNASVASIPATYQPPTVETPAAPPMVAGSGTDLGESVSSPPVRSVRSTYRPAPRAIAVRDDGAAADQAMLLVSDGRGTRVVSVPTVLVGSERIVPTSGAGASTSGSVGVAF